jgi:beta-xylosidase
MMAAGWDGAPSGHAPGFPRQGWNVRIEGIEPLHDPAGRYRNPALFADYSDPDVIRVEDRYYLVASSFHFSPGLPLLESPDLVHWRILGHVLPTLPFAREYDRPGLRYAGGVWAPAIRHHDDVYYVYWATPDEGIFMATARNPQGPWSEPIAVIRGEGFEDPCPFWDDVGKAYLIHSRVGAGPLILHGMSPDGTRVLDEGRTIVEDGKNLPVLEGPKLYKRNGWYYIFAPIGGVEKGSQAVLRARNIDGPYEARVVLARGTSAIQGPHQGGYVETPGGQGWFVHFNSTGAFGRIVYLEPVRWEDDWPIIGEPIPGQTTGQPVAEHVVPQSSPNTPDPNTSDATFRLQDSDEFTSRALGPQWEWNHNPDDTRWSLTSRPGFLRLCASPAANLDTARNTLTQVLQGPQMQVTVRMDISHMLDGQRAGLALFQKRPGWIGIVRAAGRSSITFSAEGRETPGPVIRGKTVSLRAQITRDQSALFSVAVDGDSDQHFQRLGEPVPLRFSWWKGARPALFSYIDPAAQARAGEAGQGCADFDWLRVKISL